MKQAEDAFDAASDRFDAAERAHNRSVRGCVSARHKPAASAVAGLSLARSERRTAMRSVIGAADIGKSINQVDIADPLKQLTGGGWGVDSDLTIRDGDCPLKAHTAAELRGYRLQRSQAA